MSMKLKLGLRSGSKTGSLGIIGGGGDTSAPSSLLTGLESYWKLNETSGNRADSVGGRTMAESGTVSYAAAKIGNGVDLAGTGRLLCSSSTLQISATNGFTVWGWIFIHVKNRDNAIFNMALGGTDIAQLYVSSANKANFSVLDSVSGFSGAVHATVLTTDTWYFLCGRYNQSTKKAEVSLNAGAFVLGAALSNGPKQGVVTLAIGRRPATDANAIIDEVGASGRYLSDAEVTTLYNAGNGLTYPF